MHNAARSDNATTSASALTGARRKHATIVSEHRAEYESLPNERVIQHRDEATATTRRLERSAADRGHANATGAL